MTTEKVQTIGLCYVFVFWPAEINGEGPPSASHEGTSPCQTDGSLLLMPTEDLTLRGGNVAEDAQTTCPKELELEREQVLGCKGQENLVSL